MLQEEQPHVQGEAAGRAQEGQLGRHRRAERSYSTFKVGRGGHEEIPLIQGKEHRQHLAGAAMPHIQSKRNPSRCSQRASEGRHTETIIIEN